MERQRILVWLPSPMGDIIMCTPALHALRQCFRDATLTFYGNGVARAMLDASALADEWMTQCSTLQAVRRLRRQRFSLGILFKGSLGSAATFLLAGIPQRVGYARDGRGLFLTKRLHPPRLPNRRFAPTPMVDYYLNIVKSLGHAVAPGLPCLLVAERDQLSLDRLYPELSHIEGPLVILVPGSAFGPSKCWPVGHFARTAETLIRDCRAHIVLSVSPDAQERRVAQTIVAACRFPVTNVADRPLSLGQLKALFSRADLVITNDTGPRHIAIALQRKVITLFGPNDPAWTQTGYDQEIQLVGTGPCVPCQRPTCAHPEVACMETISVDRVCQAARNMLCSFFL